MEDTLPLPSLLRLRRRSYLEQLNTGGHLSAREIARLTDVRRSVVAEAQDRFSIRQSGNGNIHPGQFNENRIAPKRTGSGRPTPFG